MTYMPYDWCDPRCPNPCICQEQIEELLRAEAAADPLRSPAQPDRPESAQQSALGAGEEA